MSQQQKRRRGHVVRDVAQMPLAAAPEWPKRLRFFSGIVTLAFAQLVELNRDRRGDFA